MRVIDKVDNRLPKLSKPEWLVLFGSYFLLIAGAISLTLLQTGGQLNWTFIWNSRALAIAVVICVVLASIKPRSGMVAETNAERLAWGTQYASFFLTFAIFGGLIFADDAMALGPLYALASDGYLFCSMAYVCYAALQQIRRINLQWTMPQSQDLRVTPLYIASILITSLGSFIYLYTYAKPDSYENCEGCEVIRVTDLAYSDIAKEAVTHGLIMVTACIGLLLLFRLLMWVASRKQKIPINFRNYWSLGMLIFSFLAVLSIRNTMPVMDDPPLAISRVVSTQGLLIILGLYYALILGTLRSSSVISATILKRTPVPVVGTMVLFLLFRDESTSTVIFGVIGLLLMVLFIFYLNDLENQILSRTEELREERAKSDALLENMLPGYVIDDLKQRGVSNPKTFPEISVMFTDFVGFTKIAQGMTPEALIDDLNKLFSGYDEIVEAHDSERIKTIGDAYMCASGLSASSSDSTANLVAVAHAIMKFTTEFNKANGRDWQLRIGIAHGDCVGGVVGEKKYLFDLFGDVVNTAARMESHSEPGRINVDEATFLKASNEGSIEGEKRPLEFVKGKGELQMYFLN